MRRRFDYVIAGGGSAGCTLAARLAENPNITVALLEAGGAGTHPFISMPAGNGFLFGNPKFDWMLESEPQPGLHGRRISYPRGKGLGGSSNINGMIYIRGNASDYDRWRQKGLEGWGYEDVLPYFIRSEGAEHRSGRYHGSDGPLKTTPAGNYDAINRIFVKACTEAGAIENPDFNGPTQEGVGRFDSKVSGGRRQSSRRAYLSKVPANLTIVTGARVRRIVLSGGRATGVETSKGDFTADKEVILCLGAFGSPQVLMLSGIGPGEHLRAVGVPVLNDLSGVGSTLWDHVNMPVQFSLKQDNMSLARLQRLDRAAATGLQYLMSRTGPAAGAFWCTHLFHALRNPQAPELQVFFTPMLLKDGRASKEAGLRGLANVGNLFLARGKTALPGVRFDINLLQPRSSGTVRLASRDPSAAPVIDPGFLQDPQDVRDLMAGVRHMRKVAMAPAFRDVLGGEVSPGAEATDDAELEFMIRQFVTTGHHPVSTCRMGADAGAGQTHERAYALNRRSVWPKNTNWGLIGDAFHKFPTSIARIRRVNSIIFLYKDFMRLPWMRGRFWTRPAGFMELIVCGLPMPRAFPTRSMEIQMRRSSCWQKKLQTTFWGGRHCHALN